MTDGLTYDTLNSLEVWQLMPTITLDEMRSVKLMNRIDTKYVLTYDEVLQLIQRAAANNYYVQIIDGVRACRYRTLYYDTATREMFRQHHNRKLCRQKLRRVTPPSSRSKTRATADAPKSVVGRLRQRSSPTSAQVPRRAHF